MPLVLDVHLETLWLICHAPDPFAVKVILEKRQEVVYRTEPMWRCATKKIDTGWNKISAIDVSDFDGQRSGVIRPQRRVAVLREKRQRHEKNSEAPEYPRVF